MAGTRIVIDIETSGRRLSELDPAMSEYMLKGAETEEERREVEDTLSFYPLTAQIVAIGMLNADTSKGAMYYLAPGADPVLPLDEDGVLYEAFSEEGALLEKFWSTIKNYKTLITFNGRGFDCPFLLVRSAMHGIVPTKQLMPNRYSDEHIDLMDRLNFFGAVRRRFSLDMWCRAFGIKSPKEETSGKEVPALFRDGRHLDIARYCVRDIFATLDLFLYWEKYIKGS